MFNQAGEHYLSSKLAVAMMYKVILKDENGNDISLYEAYNFEDGKLTLSDHYRKQYSQEQERELQRKIAKVNQKLHGIYNSIDKNVAQKYALGRLFFQFRKYVVPGFDRRWRKSHYDEILGSEQEGFYRAFGRFITGLKEDKFHIIKSYKKLSDKDKMNVNRTLRELTTFLATAVLIGALSSLRGDDSDEKILAFALVQLKRLKAESAFNWNPNEALKILKEPAASVTLIDDLVDVGEVLITPWNAFDTKERGVNTGRTNIGVAVEKVLPLPIKTIRNLTRPQDLLKNY
jgi:hypothetical protein